MDIKITRIKNKRNSFNVAMKDITAGMIMSIRLALKNHDTPVGNDVLSFLENQIEKDDVLRTICS